MDTYQIPFILRDAVLCLGMLIGVGGGIFLLVRKKTLAGLLAMLGFLLFSLEPLADLLIFQVLYQQELTDDAYTALDWMYACLGGAGIFLGSLALVMAFVLAVRSQPPASSGLETGAALDSNL